MKLATVRIEGATRCARVDGEVATLLPYASVDDLLARSADWAQEAAGATGDEVRTGGIDYAPLVSRPEKILCAGLNYRAHVLETGRAIPENPTIFAKFWRSLIGPYDDLVLPLNSAAVDWEAELAIVIGTEVRHADEDEAKAAIAGFTVANDVSMRDWQVRTTEMLQGKTFEASTPVGPWLVTSDAADVADARISCSVDGVVMQESTTADMLFDPAFLVSYLSQVITLVPGDLILTGTPSGIGGARKPPVYLQPGQTLTTSVEGLGELVNVCS